MKYNRFLLVLTVLVLGLFLLPESAEAQCAMCKAAVEKNNAGSSGGLAEGLNNGILYMMAFPYIVFGLVGFFWYRASKKNRDKRLYIERVLQNRLKS